MTNDPASTLGLMLSFLSNGMQGGNEPLPQTQMPNITPSTPTMPDLKAPDRSSLFHGVLSNLVSHYVAKKAGEYEDKQQVEQTKTAFAPMIQEQLAAETNPMRKALLHDVLRGLSSNDLATQQTSMDNYKAIVKGVIPDTLQTIEQKNRADPEVKAYQDRKLELGTLPKGFHLGDESGTMEGYRLPNGRTYDQFQVDKQIAVKQTPPAINPIDAANRIRRTDALVAQTDKQLHPDKYPGPGETTVNGQRVLIPNTPQFIKANQQHTKDWSTAVTSLQKTQNLVNAGSRLLSPDLQKGFDLNFGGYHALLTREESGAAANAKKQLDSFRDQMKTIGLELTRAGGQSIGPMAVQEWPIMEGNLGRLDDHKIDPDEARAIIKQATSLAARVQKRVKDVYDVGYKGKSQFYTPIPKEYTLTRPIGVSDADWEKYQQFLSERGKK